MALCICGDVTPEQVKAVADEVLKPAPEQEILRQYPDEPDEVCRPRIEESLEVSRPLFNIGIKVTPAGDAAERLRRAAATDILLDMMFGPSSEFYLKNYASGVISGKFGKSYESMADIACILFSGAADDPDKVYDAIREEIGKRRREGFTAEEFNRAKKVFYTCLLYTSFVDSSLVPKTCERTDIRAYYIPATKLADEAGLKGLANVIMLGKVIRCLLYTSGRRHVLHPRRAHAEHKYELLDVYKRQPQTSSPASAVRRTTNRGWPTGSRQRRRCVPCAKRWTTPASKQGCRPTCSTEWPISSKSLRATSPPCSAGCGKIGRG